MIRQALFLMLLTASTQSVAAQVPAPRAWTISSKPMFTLGAESEDTLDTFGELMGVARTPKGEIVVADMKNYSLRYFGPTGTFLRSVGRKGEGPGEFQLILRMLHCGDSLYVTEFSTDKWTVFSSAGKFGRVMNMAAMVATSTGKSRMMGAATPYAIKCNSAGVFIGEAWTGGQDKGGVFRPVVPYWIGSRGGKVTAKLGDFFGSERWGQTDADGRLRGTMPLPLGRQPVLAIGRNRAYIGTADSFVIMVFGMDGKRTGTIRRAVAPARTTKADIERFITIDTSGQSPSRAQSTLRSLAQVKYPETLPAYSALIVDSDDNLWVQCYPRAGEKASLWIIFSPAGVEVAQASLPLNLIVHEIGKDYVLGVAPEPPDGVPHVEMFRLARGGQ